MDAPIDILHKFWGYRQFKPAQEKVIQAILKKKDTIALLPTGGGKSICFQIPALAKPGICIVISPLLALMQDQVRALKNKGVKALMLSGGITFQELNQQLDNCVYGNYKFLYLSPERLQQDIVQARIQQMQVNLFAIDEAHCISEWGQDFRPSYQKVRVLREIHPDVPVIALTASATKDSLEAIKNSLQLTAPLIIKYSFERDNIAFLTRKTEDKRGKIVHFLKEKPGSGIIYVRNRKATTELSDHLRQANLSARAFHGGISNEEKTKLLNGWLTNKFRIIVATTAFGMGIDKSDVRHVIHFHLPESLESYFQEAGRGGRNDQEAYANLFYNKADELRLTNQFLKVLPTPKLTKQVYRKLNSYFGIAYGEGEGTLHNFNFNEFCKTYDIAATPCYNTLRLLDNSGVLKLSKEFHTRTELQFLLGSKALYFFQQKNPRYQKIIETLLRLQGGYHEAKIPVNLELLLKKTGMSQSVVLHLFKELQQQEVIDLTVANQDTTLLFLVPREDEHTINPIVPLIKQQYQNKAQKIQAVLGYVKNNEVCKVIQLLAYFGEKKTTPCGKCSVCLQRLKNKKINVKTEIVYAEIVRVLTQKESDSHRLVQVLPFSEEMIMAVLRQMLDKNLICVSNNLVYSLKK